MQITKMNGEEPVMDAEVIVTEVYYDQEVYYLVGQTVDGHGWYVVLGESEVESLNRKLPPPELTFKTD